MYIFPILFLLKYIGYLSENLIASKINDVSLENLIDVSATTPQTIHAPGGIEFASVVIKKSLNANGTSPCNLVETLKKVKDPPPQNWSNVRIRGNATFSDPNSTLYRVFEKAVTTNSKNIIQAPVRFSKHVLAKNVFTTELINDVNLQEIIKDAVLIDSDGEQVKL